MENLHDEFLEIIPKGEILEKIKKPFLIFVLMAVADVLSGSVRQIRQRSYLHSVISYLKEPTEENKANMKFFFNVDLQHYDKPRDAALSAEFAERGRLDHAVSYAVAAIAGEQLERGGNQKSTITSDYIQINIIVDRPSNHEFVQQWAYKYFTRELLKLIEEIK